MLQKRWFAAVSLLLLMAGLLRVTWAGEVVVKGQVLDDGDKPIGGAKVFAYGMSKSAATFVAEVAGEATSDEHGHFEFPNLRISEGVPGQAKFLYAFKQGFAWGGTSFLSGNRGECSIYLSLPGKVAGRVSDRDGRPIAGASVWPEVQWGKGNRRSYFQGVSGVPFLFATTNANGEFVLDCLPMEARLALKVEANGYAGLMALRDSNNVVPVTDVQIVLEPESQIWGTLKAEKTGKPVPGVLVFSGKQDFSCVEWGQTDARGAFRIKGLSPGDYRIGLAPTMVAEDPGGVILPCPPIQVGPGKVVENVSLLWGEGVFVEGRVLDGGSKQPVQQAQVLLHGARPWGPSWTCQTGKEGKFRIRAIPGDYRMRVHDQDHSSLEMALNVGQGPIRQVGDVLLQPKALFVMQAVDEAWTPVPKAQILGEAGTLVNTCDENGRVEFHRDASMQRYSETWYTAVSPNGDLAGLYYLPQEPGETKRVVLRKWGGITGIVKRSDGKPARDAQVQALCKARSGGPSGPSAFGAQLANTDAQGRYKMSRLVAGEEYEILVMRLGGRQLYMRTNLEGVKKYLVSPGATVEAEPIVSVAGDATITGRVVDPTGKPMADLPVDLNISQTGETYRTQTGRDGRFKFDEVARTEAYIDVKSEDGRRQSVLRRLKPEEFEDVVLVIYPDFEPKETTGIGPTPHELNGLEWLQGEWKGFEALRGKRLAVAFVSIKNRACRKVIADLETQVETDVGAHGRAPLQVILVHDASATAEEIRQFLAEKKITFPVARVTDEKNNGWFSPAFIAYKVSSVPTVVYVGVDGKIQSTGAKGP